MPGVRRRVVVVGLPFWLCLAAGLGTAPAARAVSLPSRPEKQAGVAALCPGAAPGPWVWHWLNPDAPAPLAEAEPPRPSDAGAGAGGADEAPAPFAPPTPATDDLPRQVAHAGHNSPDTMGGAGSASSPGGGGASPVGLPAGPPACDRPSIARVCLERTALLLTEHHERVFRPPRLAGGPHRPSWIV